MRTLAAPLARAPFCVRRLALQMARREEEEKGGTGKGVKRRGKEDREGDEGSCRRGRVPRVSPPSLFFFPSLLHSRAESSFSQLSSSFSVPVCALFTLATLLIADDLSHSLTNERVNGVERVCSLSDPNLPFPLSLPPLKSPFAFCTSMCTSFPTSLSLRLSIYLDLSSL